MNNIRFPQSQNFDDFDDEAFAREWAEGREAIAARFATQWAGDSADEATESAQESESSFAHQWVGDDDDDPTSAHRSGFAPEWTGSDAAPLAASESVSPEERYGYFEGVEYDEVEADGQGDDVAGPADVSDPRGLVDTDSAAEGDAEGHESSDVTGTIAAINADPEMPTIIDATSEAFDHHEETDLVGQDGAEEAEVAAAEVDGESVNAAPTGWLTAAAPGAALTGAAAAGLAAAGAWFQQHDGLTASSAGDGTADDQILPEGADPDVEAGYQPAPEHADELEPVSHLVPEPDAHAAESDANPVPEAEAHPAAEPVEVSDAQPVPEPVEGSALDHDAQAAIDAINDDPQMPTIIDTTHHGAASESSGDDVEEALEEGEISAADADVVSDEPSDAADDADDAVADDAAAHQVAAEQADAAHDAFDPPPPSEVAVDHFSAEAEADRVRALDAEAEADGPRTDDHDTTSAADPAAEVPYVANAGMWSTGALTGAAAAGLASAGAWLGWADEDDESPTGSPASSTTPTDLVTPTTPTSVTSPSTPVAADDHIGDATSADATIESINDDPEMPTIIDTTHMSFTEDHASGAAVETGAAASWAEHGADEAAFGADPEAPHQEPEPGYQATEADSDAWATSTTAEEHRAETEAHAAADDTDRDEGWDSHDSANTPHVELATDGDPVAEDQPESVAAGGRTVVDADGNVVDVPAGDRHEELHQIDVDPELPTVIDATGSVGGVTGPSTGSGTDGSGDAPDASPSGTDAADDASPDWSATGAEADAADDASAAAAEPTDWFGRAMRRIDELFDDPQQR